MQAGQGAIYGRFYLDRFQKTRSFKDITNSIFMNVRNKETGQTFVFSQAPYEGESPPLEIWKIPTGSYSVEKLSINENTGITRSWSTNGKKPTFFVSHLILSNLGLIRLSPSGRFGLRVTFLSGPNVYEHIASHQTFVSVMDGYGRKVQKILGGNQLVKDSRANFGIEGEARAAFSISRQISMTHQVDSTGTETSRRLISSTISGQDAELRRCYMDQLDLQLGLRGSVKYSFQITGRTGGFKWIRYSGGSLNSLRAVECLSLALKKLQFPVNRALSGQLAFVFNYDDNQGRAKFP